MVTGQLVDTTTHGLPTWGLDDSWTGHLADWSACGLDVGDWTNADATGSSTPCSKKVDHQTQGGNAVKLKQFSKFFHWLIQQ